MKDPSYLGPSDDSLDARQLETLADTMFALSTPSRLQILDCLRAGPRSVSDIIRVVGMEQSAVSHQLRTLRDHALVTVERRGRERLYRLRTPHVATLLDDARRHVRALDGVHTGPDRDAGRSTAHEAA